MEPKNTVLFLKGLVLESGEVMMAVVLVVFLEVSCSMRELQGFCR